MSDVQSRTLSHFALFRFTREYWSLARNDRRVLQENLLGDLQRAAAAVAVHQLYPSTAAADICVWSAAAVESQDSPGEFFQAFARATSPHRQYIEITESLWGFARPSQYSSAQRSAQAIDPFSEQHLRYLVIYPFVKTSAWYLKPRDERQALMNEHIRIGKQYSDVSQLLLYSTGLQDQEFVVVYEMNDLQRFSDLVTELRGTAGRPFTLRDTPAYTGVWHSSSQEGLRLFL